MLGGILGGVGVVQMRKTGMAGPEERVRNVLSETTQAGLMREEPSGTARFVFSNISAIFREDCWVLGRQKEH